jgi:PPOX class probable F420-dependent enzyme
MIDLDLSSPFGARVARRLREETIIWLTTVRGNLAPQPSPVWFLWQDDALLIYSKPDTPKLRSIAHNPRVALHFDGDGRGGDIIVLSGTARIDPQAPPADQVAGYVQKYAANFQRNGWTAAQFAGMYSVPILVTPTGLRGH